jgi:hypothetical protein
MTTDTPRTDACPYCGAEQKFPFAEENAGIHFRKFSCGFMEDAGIFHRPDLCKEREARQKAEAEVERLREQLTKAIGIAEWYMDNLIDSPRKVALDEIKLTLNPDNK